MVTKFYSKFNHCKYITLLCIGCSLAISIAVDSVVSPIPGRIIVHISDNDSETMRTLLTFDEDNSVANAVITLRDPQQQNIQFSLLSNCHVSNLEVYQGKQRTIKICHNGFNISNQGNIEVSASVLPNISYYNSQKLVS